MDLVNSFKEMSLNKDDATEIMYCYLDVFKVIYQKFYKTLNI